jgi:3',5'-cyclic AMP phosphodiesterase CpdA
LSPRPDLVVISGDITTNSALPKKYEHAKTLLADALAALLERHPRALLVAQRGMSTVPTQTACAGVSATICPPVPIGEFPGPYGSADTAPPRL